MEPTRTLAQVVAELLEVSTELDRTADARERSALRDRLHELRAEAAAVRGSEPSTMSDDALRTRITACRRLLADLGAARFDVSAIGGATGLGGGLDPMQTAEHNRRIDTTGGRADLERELLALLDELARRR